jgi:hypothetical protein
VLAAAFTADRFIMRRTPETAAHMDVFAVQNAAQLFEVLHKLLRYLKIMRLSAFALKLGRFEML